MLKLKYYCHIKYVGNQFRYIAHEKYLHGLLLLDVLAVHRVVDLKLT